MNIWVFGLVENTYEGLKLDFCLFSTIKNVCEIVSIYVGHRKWMFNIVLIRRQSSLNIPTTAQLDYLGLRKKTNLFKKIVDFYHIHVVKGHGIFTMKIKYFVDAPYT